jgi:hypothetical protein
MLCWPADKLKIPSVGTINKPGKLPKLRGTLPMAAWRGFSWRASRIAHSAPRRSSLDVHQRKATWRIDQTTPDGMFESTTCGAIIH